MTMVTGGRAPAQAGTGPLVLLVDDHQLFGEVIAMRLVADPEIGEVVRADSVPAAVQLLDRLRPDVVLLEYHVGPDCGLDLLGHLDRLDHRPVVLLLADDLHTGHIVAALRAGAHGWVHKGAGVGALTGAITRATAGDLVLPEVDTAELVRALLRDPDPEPAEEFLSALSGRRREVLRCLVAGMSQEETARHLRVSKNTVRSHVQALFRQFGVHSTGSLTALARAAGVGTRAG